ncbi:VRR-NUC domain-containing protein [[Clostridium] symbiosum]|uniref:VRR-NUC domain-containing protein n=1 Tax=Clostridium symbiosum TaxID=1512 RepID=UPI001898FC73|nr:VRR-NUC domain-containing protein [[Clostridium] symbiosum]
MLEKEIEKILVSEVKKLGGRAYKWVSPGNDGVPDRIVIFPNRPPIFVELKSETGWLSALQQVQIKRLRELGQAVFVVRGLEGVKVFFEELGYLDTASNIATRYDL